MIERTGGRVPQALPTREGWARAGAPGLPVWQTGQVGADTRHRDVDVQGPVLDEQSRRLAERIADKYPTRRSALVPLLYLVQSEVGWVPHQGMREVAEILGTTTAEVEAVATFYTMFKLHPCGKYVISICTNPSCALVGGRRLLERAKELLGHQAEDGVTDDGLFTLEEEECLAACDKAPVLTVNYLYYDRVSEEQLERMLELIRAGDVPEASRGGVPGELKEVSRTLAGLGSLRPPAESDPGAAPGRSGGPAERRTGGNQPGQPSEAGGLERPQQRPHGEEGPSRA